MNKTESHHMLTDVQEDSLWNQLHYEPAALKDMKNATADMQAFALRRRAYLIFDDINWLIVPEQVCPGITAWKTHFEHDFYAAQASNNPVLFVQVLIKMVAQFEPLRKLAFLSPKAINSNSRSFLAVSTFNEGKRHVAKLVPKQWARGPYPERDIQRRVSRTSSKQGV